MLAWDSSGVNAEFRLSGAGKGSGPGTPSPHLGFDGIAKHLWRGARPLCFAQGVKSAPPRGIDSSVRSGRKSGRLAPLIRVTNPSADRPRILVLEPRPAMGKLTCQHVAREESWRDDV